MLTHKVLGPDASGKFSVGYPTPGTTTYTVVFDGCTEDAARAEVSRLNRQQRAIEYCIREDLKARGLCGTRTGRKDNT